MEPTNLDAKVRERAYELWEEAGSPWGKSTSSGPQRHARIEGEKIDPVTLTDPSLDRTLANQPFVVVPTVRCGPKSGRNAFGLLISLDPLCRG